MGAAIERALGGRATVMSLVLPDHPHADEETAQRIANGPKVREPWPRDLPALTRNQMLALQTALNTHGFDSGTPDGMLGPATQRGIRQYQRSVGLAADGYPTLDLLQRLQ